MGLNDSHVVEIHCEKTLCPEFDEEKILVELSEYTGEPRFDKLTEDLPLPTRIFLGGTCQDWRGEQWRDSLIPELEGRGIDYFRPDRNMEQEIIEKNERCDSHLYVLTPAVKDLFSIAEIMNSVWEVKEYNFGSCFTGILGNEEDWGEEYWRSLQALTDLINSQGRSSKKIGVKFIENPIEILEFYGKPKKRRKKNE